MDIRDATTPDDIESVRTLFTEYAQATNIAPCFQGFDKELASLPGEYARPAGRLLLALDDGQASGCVGLRPLDVGTCEMKRLYVRPAQRGAGIARGLVARLLADAKEIGYETMRLDTLPVMVEAIAFYRGLGFREIAPYYEHPVEGALFMELGL